MNIEIAITRSYLQALGKLPKNIQKKANELFDKFKENPDAASINYEKINNTKDAKVRTVRVDQKYRAVVLHPDVGNLYMFVYIDNHDEAMDWARNRIFNINEHTSALQVVDLNIINDLDQEYVEKDERIAISGRYSDDELLIIGIPKMIIPVLKIVYDMEDLVDKIKSYVSDDIFEILEFCVEGLPIEEILECFAGETVNENDSLLDIINKPVNKDYVCVVTNDDLIKEVLKDPIDYWRIFMHPIQRKFVYGNKGQYKGSFQLKGAAGTGKTVVAMHRAKYLAENVYTSDGDMVLYTTYSKKLTKSVEYNLKNMCSIDTLRRIEVVNLHSLIANYLKKHKLKFKIVDDQSRYKFARHALQKLGLDTIYSENDILQEIDAVISYYQLTDYNAYLKVSRNGTYKKLGKSQRMEMWSILSEYFEMLNESNQKEWWMVIHDTVNMINRKNEQPYKAIIVDEAQDFNMPEYRFLRALISEGPNDLYIVGDIRQKIYSGQVNFSKCGINILGNRTRELILNYRNTYEINQFAYSILQDVQFKSMDDSLVIGNKAHTIISGEKPVIKQFRSSSEEVEYICAEVAKITAGGIAHNEIAIIARTNGIVKEFSEGLKKNGIMSIPLEDVDSLNQKKIYIGTMHSIKGFEFKIVFIVGANNSMIPFASHLERLEYERERELFMKMEKALLYVAATRARDKLYLIGSPEISDWVLMRNEF